MNHVYYTRDKARANIFNYIEVFYDSARHLLLPLT